MKQFQKIMLLGAFFLLPQIACNSQNKNVSESAKDLAANSELLAMNNANTNVRVFTISDVKNMGANKAADFTWTENGKTVKFSEYTKGKVVFLNFWGTWCPPCKAEIPDIIEIAAELSGKEIVVVGMATERPNDANPLATVTKFAQDRKITYINFIGNDAVRTIYGGIQSIPTTFIIDKDGSIVETINGMKDKASFMTSIKKVLK